MMAVTTLTLGAVSIGSPPGESGVPSVHDVVVGAPPQWSDGDDATYAYLVNALAADVAAAHAQADPVDGNLLGFTANVRASANPDFGPDTAEVDLYLRHVPTNGYADAVVTFPADGAVHDLAVSGIVYEDNNPDGWLAEGIYAACVVRTFGSRVYIHEVSVTVTTDVEDVIRPATRMFPRDDALGLSSAPRLVPPPKARRVVGGYL